MARFKQASDDPRLALIRKGMAGGVNTRHHGSIINENQATLLYNVEIETVGQTSKMAGSTLIGDDLGANSIVGLWNYSIQGATDQLLSYEGTTLRKWEGTGNWSAAIKSDFTAAQTDIGFCNAKMSGISPDDIVIVQNGTDNPFGFKSDGTNLDLGATAGTGSDSPPKSTVMAWYGNRLWVLKNDLLYFSAAYSSDYSAAFDTVNDAFRIPVGAERVLLSTRDLGIVVGGANSIWSLLPSVTPVATDRAEPLVPDIGVVSKNGACEAADDVYFFAHDGLRGLKRTVNDKLQSGQSFPVSYGLKTEFDAIDWGYINQLSMVYWKNRVIVSVPTGASTYDTWVYYPALNAFTIIKGWSPRSMATYQVSGEKRFYYGKHGDGTVYRGFYGYTNEGTTTSNGTAINYQEEGRKEDLDNPLVKKVGGTLKIKALTAGNYDLTVSASLDDNEYSVLGTMNINSNNPALPVNLPFTLSAANLAIQEFPLDQLGEWYQIRIKIQHNATNSTDTITIYEKNLTTFKAEYEDEV